MKDPPKKQGIATCIQTQFTPNARGPSGPVLVEVVGLPGSGKSTLARALLLALRAKGVTTWRADKLAGLDCVDSEAPRYLRRGPDRAMLFRSLAFRRAHPELTTHMEHKLELNAEAEFLYSLTTTLYQAWHEHQDRIDVVLLDEGFAHRGVSAHLDQEDALLKDYMRLMPLPDVTLHLCPPPRMAFRRAINRRADRGAHRRKVEAKLGDQMVFRRRHRLLEAGLVVLRDRGANVIDINTALAPEMCCETALEAVLTALPNHPDQKSTAKTPT